MESFFSSDFFIGNRRRLRALFPGNAPIVLTAHGQMQRNTDNAYDFRQDSSFWYLTGINEPDVVLVMDKDKEYLIVPERETVTEQFYGSLDRAHLKARSGVSDVLDYKSGWKQLNARLKRVKHVATLAPAPAYLTHYQLYTNPARSSLTKKMQRANPAIELLDLRTQMATMRMIKQPEELLAIKRAIAITAKTLKKIKRRLPRLSNERQIHALLDSEYTLAGAQHAFHPVVASGEHAVTLHYVHNNQPLRSSAFTLIDTGAEIEGYAADITRTFARGSVSKRHRVVYEAVQSVQQFAYDHLTLGKSVREYEREVRQFMGEKLRELGLIRHIDSETIAAFYPQATSHFLGLDAHDAGDYDTPLSPGMVLTIEPGIYIAKEGIGVRIEDDVLVTKKGLANLCANLPSTLD